eukprot:m.88685 g.88685  ORF g.88685 m.88685 type:complete len:275 (-) comp26224_c1_seq1:72-896(-)
MSETAKGLIPGPHQLSEEETKWCVELRAALKEAKIPEPAPQSDFLLAQFAIVGKGQTEKAVKRIQKYHKVVTELYAYDPDKAIKSEGYGWWCRTMPDCLQPCGDSLAEKYPTVSYNVSLYDPKIVLEGDNLNYLITDMLLIMDAMNADLDDIRKGSVWVSSCKGAGMKNYNGDLEKKQADVYQDSYPAKFHSFTIVDGGWFINVILKLAKLFLKKKLRDRIFTTTSDKVETLGYEKAKLPASVGGTFKQPYAEYMDVRLARRTESIQKVKIVTE